MAVVAIVSMLGGALATTGVAFALLPAITGNSFVTLFGSVPVAEAAQASNQQTAMPSGAETKMAPAVKEQSQDVKVRQAVQPVEVKSPYPVHRKAAVQGVAVALAVEGDEDADVSEPVEPEAVEERREWVEGWTETIVHPAVYDDIPSYESYICTDCGYESLDLSDIIEHIEEHEDAAYNTVENDCPRVELEKEWTETIYHEGHWA